MERCCAFNLDVYNCLMFRHTFMYWGAKSNRQTNQSQVQSSVQNTYLEGKEKKKLLSKLRINLGPEWAKLLYYIICTTSG